MNLTNTKKSLPEKFILAVFAMFPIFLGFLHPNAWAELHFTELKGLQECVRLKPEYEYLHPVQGFSLIKLPFLTNLYNYSAPTLSEAEQSPSEAEEPKGKTKEVWDPTEKLVQSIFNVPPGTDSPTFFQVSPLAKKLGRFLGPSTIGEILAQISISDDQREKIKTSDLKQSLLELIQRDPEFQTRVKEAGSKVVEIQKEIDEKYGHLTRACNEDLKNIDQAKNNLLLKKKLHNEQIIELNRTSSNEIQDSLENQVQALSDELKQININISDLEKKKKQISQDRKLILLELLKVDSVTNEVKDPQYKKLLEKIEREKYEPLYLKHFVEQLLISWQFEGTEKSLYPRHMSEQILIALAWKNTKDHDKASLLELYKKLPHLLIDGKLDCGDAPFEVYSKNDYDQIVNDLTSMLPEDRAAYLLKHPEQTAFLTHGKSFYDPKALPELGFHYVRYQHPKAGPVFFTDCMDSSILNFLALVMRNPETGMIDSSVLDLEDSHFQIAPEIREFLDAHEDTSSLDTQQTHESWIPLVSQKKDVKYVNNGYEVDTRVDNLFLILGDSLFRSSSGVSVFSGLRHHSEKMTKLCRLLSRDGFEFNWRFSSGNKEDFKKQQTNVSITFTINGEEAFDWDISDGHSDITIKRNHAKNWTLEVGRKIGMLIRKGGMSLSPLQPEFKTFYWLENSNAIAHLKLGRGISEGTNESIQMRYLGALSNVEDKLALVKELLIQDKIRNLKKIEKILDSIRSTDLGTQMKILDLVLRCDQREHLGKYIINFFSLFKDEKQKEEAVFEAVRLNKAVLLKEFVLNSFPIFLKNFFFATPLHQASYFGFQEVVATLLQSLEPYQVHAQDKNGNTAIHRAMSRARTEVVKLLITHCSSKQLNAKNVYGRTPLHELLSYPDRSSRRKQLIDFFIRELQPEQLNEKDKKGLTPLDEARLNGHTEAVKLLTDRIEPVSSQIRN